MNNPDNGRNLGRMILLVVLLLGVFILYLFIGRYPRLGFTSIRDLLHDTTTQRVFFSLRLPRALGAFLLGTVLGGAGAMLQTIFGNPLVDAGFLGVSQGSAFGAAIALVLGSGPSLAKNLGDKGLAVFVMSLSFVMALGALALSLFLAKKFKFGGQVLRLVLAGLAVSAFFSSLLAAVKYVADPLKTLPDIVFWTMGSLSAMTWQKLAGIAPLAAASVIVMFVLRWRSSLLSLDDQVSRSLGLHPEAERAIAAVFAALGVAAMTASCGIVAWVGLVVPQGARIIFGPDGRDALPASMLGGAVFVLLADGIAKNLFSGELPLGIVTALMGALLFVFVLTSRKTEMAR